MATITEIPAVCPECGTPNPYDNRTSKLNPKAPDSRCRSKECSWAGWIGASVKAAQKPAGAKTFATQGRNMGPYVPGLDDGDPGPYEAVITQHVEPRAKATTIHSDDVKLIAECLEAGVRAVAYTRKFLTPADDIAFTSDNICSIASTLFIETRRNGR